jgi:hypothetical protein
MRWSPFGKVTVVLAAAAVAAGACTSSPSPKSAGPSPGQPQTEPLATGSGYRPAIDPANFGSPIDNPFFPLSPGATFVYEGVKDGASQRDEVTVTRRTRVVLGVPCVVVEDTSTHGGTLLEKTEDWYTQDAEGNVWYFGEDTAEYENGKVSSTEGSWQAGVDGAQPGIVMPAHPNVTDSFRQEYLPGQAEDTFWIVSLTQAVSVPYGHFGHAMLTLEFTRLEPNVIDEKVYVQGVGLVRETTAAGPKEVAELVSVTGP